MAYETLATERRPALIIYLMDVSASMMQPLDERRRIDVVNDALRAVIHQMIYRSTKGRVISPRYRVAVFAYSDRSDDILNGIRPVNEIGDNLPLLSTQRTTNTASAFLDVERLLQDEWLNLDKCPAPLICHMTDGEFTGEDPEPIVRRIMNMENEDGHVLIENIFISDSLLDRPIRNVKEWQGILPTTRLKNEYAQKLRDMSSPLPASYRLMMKEMGYRLDEKAVMMLPGVNSTLIEMGFVMSSSTGASR